MDKSIFLLTDAIGKKIIELIKEGNITFAFSILKTKQKEFENWVLHERTKNKIRTDDTTAVWIKIDETPKS